MKQRELARQLGLSESAVSKLAKAGMPTHSVEAAAGWRRARVAPYVKSHQQSAPNAPINPAAVPPRVPETTGPDIDTAAELRAFAAATPDPVDFIDALAHNTAILAGDDLLAVLHALGMGLHAATRTGGNAQAIDSAVRRLMHLVPPRLRERVAFDEEVWRHLLRDYLQRRELTPLRAPSAADDEGLAVGLHLYGLACGEWVLRD